MKYEILNLKERKIVGIQNTIENTEEGMQKIGNLWNSMMAKGVYQSIQNKQNNYCYGIYHNYKFGENLTYDLMVGAESNDINENLKTIIIPEGKYAKFTIKGHFVNDVKIAWIQIWQMKDLNRKFGCDFELYLNDSQDMNNQTIEIYISIN